MSDSSEMEENLTTPDILETNNLLPEKSRKVYDKCYQEFMVWKIQKKQEFTKQSAFSPEVICKQANINIGTTCHVLYENSTVVKANFGVQPVEFKNELQRKITIKLERLPDTIVNLYCERAADREYSTILLKCKRNKKRREPEAENEPSLKKKREKKQETDEFIIENIIDFKLASGEVYFYVKWKGYTAYYNTWEPIGNLNNCPRVLSTFILREEVKRCSAIEKLKKEISFDGLAREDNLITRLKEVEKNDIVEIKQTLLLKLLCMLILTEEEEEIATHLVQESRDLLQLLEAARKRARQLKQLKNWEKHLNQIDICKKLIVENIAEFAGQPENFKYINKSIHGTGVNISDDPPMGCECTACNCRSKCRCGLQDGFYSYTVNKRLRIASGTPIFECNRACKCSERCSNRVVQGGRNIKLCIFRTSNGCGWGVKTEQKIRQGQFICQYVGEVITFEEAEKRGREYDANGSTYLFDLDFNSEDNPYTVDAAHYGNVSHFINHSCEPNLGVWAVWADCLDPNLPMLALFATEDIEAGKEICIDYLQKVSSNDGDPTTSRSMLSEVQSTGGQELDVPGDIDLPLCVVPASPKNSRFAVQQNMVLQHKHRTECKCGSIKCRKYLF